MNDSLKTPLVLVGRVLLALIFVTSGYSKLAGIEGTAGYIASAGLPWPTALAAAAGLFELVAGLALVSASRHAGPRSRSAPSRCSPACCSTPTGRRRRTSSSCSS